jgi:hypothetical protein
MVNRFVRRNYTGVGRRRFYCGEMSDEYNFYLIEGHLLSNTGHEVK